MVSVTLFVVMTIIAIILLVIASIACIVGAADAFGSANYNTDVNIRNAHQWLTIGAALGASSVVVFLLIIIIAAAAGGFSMIEITDTFLNNKTPSAQDVANAFTAEKSLSSGQGVTIIVLIVLIIIAIITFIVGILAAIAASDLSSARTADAKVSSAYTAAIVGAVSGIAGIIVLIICIVTYVAIRNLRSEQIAKLKIFEDEFTTKKSIKKSDLESTNPFT